MRFGSVCSGIEAASCAWHDLGWKAAWLSEIEPFPSAVLKHHYPDVPNFGDMTKFKEWDQNATINVLVGGTPCQSFSVAGLRKGLDDPRGNLMLTYLAIANKYRPKWLVWENVPGVLSSNGGQDFASLLRGMGELGYGFAYRVLDAQYFGVAQRRRRVFVVGCLGDWRSAAAVLFESHSLSGNPAPSREKREVTPTLTKECTGVSRTGHNVGRQPQNGGNGDGFTVGGPMYTLNATGVHGVAQPISFHVDAMPDQMNFNVETAASLTCSQHAGVAIPIGTDCYNGLITGDIACTMGTPGSSVNASDPTVMQNMAVRRLTPIECERLQGFPDNYTNIPWRKKDESPDGPRYKALGNSMAVPVMKWIGSRIQQLEEL